MFKRSRKGVKSSLQNILLMLEILHHKRNNLIINMEKETNLNKKKTYFSSGSRRNLLHDPYTSTKFS